MKKILITLFLLATLLTTSCVNDPAHITGSISANVTNTSLAIQQNVIADPHNSSTSNILSGANFTGNATSTLGVNAIQVSLKTDQNMLVYVEQSPDGANWDIIDHFDYIYSLGGASWTVQAVNSYYRVVVININGIATTYLRLQTALCPIVEAVPRSLSDDGRFLTEATIIDDYGNDAEISPDNELKVTQSVKLVGGIFIGTIVDSNFWTTNTSANGSVFQDIRTSTTGGELSLTTNTTANGAARISSIRRGRYVAGNSNYARFVVHTPDNGTVNNQRRWGVVDYTSITSITDGAYFELNGTTLSVVTMRGGTANRTSDGSFNGKWGTHYHIDSNTSHIYEIYYTTFSVLFSVDGVLLHNFSIGAYPWSNTPTLYIYADNVNSGGSVTDVILHIRTATIHRLGPTLSSPKYVNISTGTTTILKYSAGTLQSITLNQPTNITITVYDNIAASGSIIATITPQPNSPPVTLTYGIDFSTGLCIVTSGAINLTVVYE